MIVGIYHFITVLISWWIALAFVRVRKTAIVFNSVISAAFCGIAAAVLKIVNLPEYIFLAECVIFILATVALQLQRQGEYGDSVLAFLLAQAAHSVLAFVGKTAVYQTEPRGILLSLVFIAFFAGMTVKWHSRFPDAEWREYYANPVPEPGRINLRVWHVYLIPLLLAVLSALALVLIDAESVLELLLWSIFLSCVFWFGMILLILMHTYKKERISLLLEQQYREEMQVFLNVIRSQRHDYNFHVQTIAGLIQDGKIEECKKYVNALERDSSVMNSVLPLHDPAISSMIHNFQTLAVRAGIELHIDIQNDLAQISTNVYETNKIISNLIQNAIDEVSTHQDKSYGIWLTILKRGEFCVIRVSNKLEHLRSAEELGRIYQQGYTTKHGHDGVGLSSIKALAARYKGTVYTQMEGNVIHFVAKVPINYTKTPVTDK